MSPLLVTILLKFVLPLVLQELVKSKLMSEAEAAGIKTLDDFIVWVRALKTYPEYPQDQHGAAVPTYQAWKDKGHE